MSQQQQKNLKWGFFIMPGVCKELLYGSDSLISSRNFSFECWENMLILIATLKMYCKLQNAIHLFVPSFLFQSY